MPMITRSMSFRDKIIEPLPYKYKSLTNKKKAEVPKQSRFSRFFEELESVVIMTFLVLMLVILFAAGFELLHNYLMKYHPHLIAYYAKETFAIYTAILIGSIWLMF